MTDGLNIVVCIKQVPDSAQISVDPKTNTIMRQGAPTIINPYDLYALEAALSLRDRTGGRVTVLTMGPAMAADALRKAMGHGADDAVLMSDRFFAGSDTLATSFVLAQAIARIGRDRPVDMVFTGKQTIDGDTAQVGPGLAQRLDLNQLTYVAEIQEVDLAQRQLTVQRRAEGGLQTLQTRLPALVSVLEDTHTLRRGSLPDVLRAQRAEIPTWDAAAVGIEDTQNCGLRGSATKVVKMFAPPAKSERAKLLEGEDDTPDAQAAAVIAALEQADPELFDVAAGQSQQA